AVRGRMRPESDRDVRACHGILRPARISGQRRRITVRWILAFFAALLLSACADTGLPVTPTPTTRPEPTALPPLDAWTQAAAPITLDNVQQITQLGRLDAPEPPSTLFAHALSLDNAYLAGLHNDFLLVWDLVTGELILANDRLGAKIGRASCR